MARHKHADVMIAYANDASLVIQIKDEDSEWQDLPVNYSPSFYDSSEYRIKPKEAEKGDFICEIDGIKWWLGPESEEEMSWVGAQEWCERHGCVLPPREVLLMCYLNKNIRSQFKNCWYWSSNEYEHNPAVIAWVQFFNDGYQRSDTKDDTYYVRGVISS